MLVSFYLSAEHQFNVFEGMVAVTELTIGNKYAALPGERVLIKSKDWDGNFQNAFFDSWEDMPTPVPSGKGVKDGVKYTYYMDKTVTSSYTIIILLKE